MCLSNFSEKISSVTSSFGFNPCFNGCASRITLTTPAKPCLFVSILVLMDVPLESECRQAVKSRYKVSILVLMDVPLEYRCEVETPSNQRVSILVLMDVPLEYHRFSPV